MIIDKQPLPEDPTPVDPPPSYDSYDRHSIPTVQDSKHALGNQPIASGSTSPLQSPTSLSPRLPKTPISAGGTNKGKGRAGVNWFRFNSAETRTAREVRNTVLGLMRDLIQEHNTPAAAGILQSCADACASRDISLSSILQEKAIENHTPLYWAIVKRPPDERQDGVDGVDLLTALISYATPLTQQTIAEVRLACLVTSDQALFQRLRLSPEFAPVSKVDQMLLGATIPPEEIELEELLGDDGGAFAVNFVIPQFHKRMLVSKEIGLEFIARSRLWKLLFFVTTEPRTIGSKEVNAGSWCISLSLLEISPPTYLQARLLVLEADEPTTTAPSNPTSPTSSPFWSVAGRTAPTSTTKFIDLSSNQEQLEPGTGRRNSGRSVMVCLDDSVIGPNFQYGNNPYIGADEKLRVRLEARLGRKATTDCIIC
ncbi:hypothetical protein CPC08DRAFT_642960 [Agrocybe pediades]|nr:hypothetical protein CPC08DRAFT_642960 [Agrocybe pediades]